MDRDEKWKERAFDLVNREREEEWDQVRETDRDNSSLGKIWPGFWFVTMKYM